MQSRNLPARFQVIAALQQRRDQSQNQIKKDTCDHAIDMAVVSERDFLKEHSYLVADFERDARKTVTRRSHRAQRLDIPYWEQSEHALSVSDGTVPICYQLPSNSDDPFSTVLANQLAERLSEQASEAGGYIPAVIHDMAEGCTVDETAQHIGISSSYVKKLRRQARNVAEEVLR